MRFKNRSGFTLIEMLLVLGIALCIIVTVFIVDPHKLERYVFLGIYEENNFNLSNNSDFKNFTTINKNIDSVSLKVEKTSISPSSLIDSGLSNTMKNIPINFCYNAFLKPDKLKIYYIKINDKIIYKKEDLSKYCDSISRNAKDKINIVQYLY